MKFRYRTITILIFSITGLAACSAPAGDAPLVDRVAARAEIDAAVTAMFQAYADNDAEAYFGFFADDAVMLGGEEQPATEYEESWTNIIASGGGVVSIDPTFPRSIRLSDDANTAIILVDGIPATYRFPDASEVGKFNERSYAWAMTHVWTRINGNWKLVHFHYHNVSD